MSAQPASVDLPPVNTVETILVDLIEMSTEAAHLQDDLVARGVPLNTIRVLVEQLKKDMQEEFKVMFDSALESATNRLGHEAVSETFLLQHLERLTALNQDMAHLRKIARGHEMDTLAVNMLTKLVSANPGDQGERVLNCLVDYGRCLGIKVTGLRLITSNDALEDSSVLPQIDLPDLDKNPWHRYGTLLIEVLLGFAVTFTAISLLT